jgi:hypothetical protein
MENYTTLKRKKLQMNTTMEMHFTLSEKVSHKGIQNKIVFKVHKPSKQWWDWGV